MSVDEKKYWVEIELVQDELEDFKKQYERDKQNEPLEKQTQKTTKPNCQAVMYFRQYLLPKERQKEA